jgi:hypothetical protein
MEEESVPCCVGCLASLEERDDFCPNCGAVANGLAELDPIGLIRAEGDLFRRGAERPTKIVLIGFWLLFLPVLVVVTALVSSAGGFYARSLPSVALIILYSAILLRVTRNYTRNRNR